MPYLNIEKLRSRRGEKVGPFITVENAIGMGLFAGPFFLMNDLHIVLRAILVILGVIVGVLVTQESRGMIFCERVLWRLRGQFRQLVRGNLITPSDLPGTRTMTMQHRAVARGGIVRKSRHQRAAQVVPPTVAERSFVVRRRDSQSPAKGT